MKDSRLSALWKKVSASISKMADGRRAPVNKNWEELTDKTRADDERSEMEIADVGAEDPEPDAAADVEKHMQQHNELPAGPVRLPSEHNGLHAPGETDWDAQWAVSMDPDYVFQQQDKARKNEGEVNYTAEDLSHSMGMSVEEAERVVNLFNEWDPKFLESEHKMTGVPGRKVIKNPEGKGVSVDDITREPSLVKDRHDRIKSERERIIARMNDKTSPPDALELRGLKKDLDKVNKQLTKFMKDYGTKSKAETEKANLKNLSKEPRHDELDRLNREYNDILKNPAYGTNTPEGESLQGKSSDLSAKIEAEVERLEALMPDESAAALADAAKKKFPEQYQKAEEGIAAGDEGTVTDKEAAEEERIFTEVGGLFGSIKNKSPESLSKADEDNIGVILDGLAELLAKRQLKSVTPQKLITTLTQLTKKFSKAIKGRPDLEKKTRVIVDDLTSKLKQRGEGQSSGSAEASFLSDWHRNDPVKISIVSRLMQFAGGSKFTLSDRLIKPGVTLVPTGNGMQPNYSTGVSGFSPRSGFEEMVLSGEAKDVFQDAIKAARKEANKKKSDQGKVTKILEDSVEPAYALLKDRYEQFMAENMPKPSTEEYVMYSPDKKMTVQEPAEDYPGAEHPVEKPYAAIEPKPQKPLLDSFRESYLELAHDVLSWFAVPATETNGEDDTDQHLRRSPSGLEQAQQEDAVWDMRHEREQEKAAIESKENALLTRDYLYIDGELKSAEDMLIDLPEARYPELQGLLEAELASAKATKGSEALADSISDALATISRLSGTPLFSEEERVKKYQESQPGIVPADLQSSGAEWVANQGEKWSEQLGLPGMGDGDAEAYREMVLKNPVAAQEKANKHWVDMLQQAVEGNESAKISELLDQGRDATKVFKEEMRKQVEVANAMVPAHPHKGAPLNAEIKTEIQRLNEGMKVWDGLLKGEQWRLEHALKAMEKQLEVMEGRKKNVDLQKMPAKEKAIFMQANEGLRERYEQTKVDLDEMVKDKEAIRGATKSLAAAGKGASADTAAGEEDTYYTSKGVTPGEENMRKPKPGAKPGEEDTATRTKDTPSGREEIPGEKGKDVMHPSPGSEEKQLDPRSRAFDKVPWKGTDWLAGPENWWRRNLLRKEIETDVANAKDAKQAQKDFENKMKELGMDYTWKQYNEQLAKGAEPFEEMAGEQEKLPLGLNQSDPKRLPPTNTRPKGEPSSVPKSGPIKNRIDKNLAL